MVAQAPGPAQPACPQPTQAHRAGRGPDLVARAVPVGPIAARSTPTAGRGTNRPARRPAFQRRRAGAVAVQAQPTADSWPWTRRPTRGQPVPDGRKEAARLVDDHRDRYLWFLRPDFVPTTAGEIPRTLDQVERGGDRACRFFPLIEDDLLGLALHPFDLATNKALSIASRVEARDWIHVPSCHSQLQPLGYRVWAACGRDPGCRTLSLLSYCARRHFSRAEINDLEFDGAPPDAAELGRTWHQALHEAEAICARLPSERVGTCVLAGDSEPWREAPDRLPDALRAGRVTSHEGRIRGSWPTVLPSAADA